MSKYPITILLAVLCSVIFLVQLTVPSLTDTFVLQSQTVAAQPWTLLTSIFLHGSFAHLVSNMFALALFGLILEHIIGRTQVLGIFLAAGVIAGSVAVFFYSSTLGASGAIFGIMGTLAVLRPRMVVWVLGVPMPMILASVVWVLIDLLGVFFPSDVANTAHIAGLLAGMGMGLILRPHFVQEVPVKSPAVLSDEEIMQWEDAYLKNAPKHRKRKK